MACLILVFECPLSCLTAVFITFSILVFLFNAVPISVNASINIADSNSALQLSGSVPPFKLSNSLSSVQFQAFDLNASLIVGTSAAFSVTYFDFSGGIIVPTIGAASGFFTYSGTQTRFSVTANPTLSAPFKEVGIAFRGFHTDENCCMVIFSITSINKCSNYW